MADTEVLELLPQGPDRRLYARDPKTREYFVWWLSAWTPIKTFIAFKLTQRDIKRRAIK